MYVITGATGHIGSAISSLLLERGQEVRAIGRDLEKLRPLINKGAEACVGTLVDAGFLANTFKNADAVFIMIPPNSQAEDYRLFQKYVTRATVKALKTARVRHVVNLSSIGAELGKGNGPIAGLHDQEQQLAKIKDIKIDNLRPAFFMENLLPNVEMVRKKSLNGTPLKADLQIPMIATRDIAHAAVDCLLTNGDHKVTVHELLGPRDLSMNEITRILSQAMARPNLIYVQFPYTTAREAMIAAGISESVADLYIEMYKAINEGRIMHNIARSPGNTTPTSIESFIQEVVSAD